MPEVGPKQFGVVGLGRMGGGLAIQASGKGMRVVGFDPGKAPQALDREGIEVVRQLDEFRSLLPRPRVVLLYVPAGRIVDQVIDALVPALDPGDVIVDGGNSYWGDSIRRHARLSHCGILFADLGTSGGVSGALHGACFMLGADEAAVRLVEPIVKELAVPGGYAHAGPPGAGHFAKLVHNGIEFVMLEAIGEGVDLLQHSRIPVDVGAVLSCWRNGSVIRSWLVDLMEAGYRSEQGLRDVPPFVDDTGEVNWLVTDALNMDVPVPAIAIAVMQLVESRDRERVWARAIAVMRHEFGGHAYGASKAAEEERHEGRVGDFFVGGSMGQ
jgi:6-phosphogluconate dehydrogenase